MNRVLNLSGTNAAAEPGHQIGYGSRVLHARRRRALPGLPGHVTALLSALSFRDPRPELLTALDAPAWQQLLAFGDHMHLTLPLAQAWGDYLPDWVRARVDSNIADNTQRFQTLKNAYAEVADTLRNADVENVVLKGFTKSPDYVPEPRHRIQCDIDLFCPPETVFHARDALTAIGYEPVYQFEDMPWDHLPGLRRKSSWQWRGNAYDPEMPLGVELHHTFWDHAAARYGPTDLSAFWERRVERRLEDLSFSALNPIDNLGYLALNLLRDLLRAGIVTSQVYELAWFLHKNSRDAEFWMHWSSEHSDELRRLESISFLLAATWFDCDLPEAVTAEIEQLPVATQRWFEIPATSPSPMGWMRPSKASIWLHSSLLASSAEKWKLVLQKLFLPRVRPVNVIAAEVPSAVLSASKASAWRDIRQYVAYLFTRAKFHLWVLPKTLWQGLCWWRAARN